MIRHPSVTFVIPNWNGCHLLGDCLHSIQDLDYPKEAVEVVVVDNGSQDESVPLIRKEFPGARVLENRRNTGFAKAVNRGAREARGEILSLLNNDMRIDPSWLKRMVEPLHGDVVCTGSRILNWSGDRFDFDGSILNFQGIGKKEREGMPAGDGEAEWRGEKEIIFPCGGAMAIQREVFLASGMFDEDYFAYYEDIDLGWRLWVLGYRILFVPGAVAFHRYGASSSRVPLKQLRVLHIRNPLYTLVKNYEEEGLKTFLAGAILLSLRRTLMFFPFDDTEFRIEKGGEAGFLSRLLGRERRETMEVRKLLMSDLVAYGDVIRNFPNLLEKRKRIQAKRKRGDREIFRLFLKPFWVIEADAEYQNLQRGLDLLFDYKDFVEKEIPKPSG